MEIFILQKNLIETIILEALKSIQIIPELPIQENFQEDIYVGKLDNTNFRQIIIPARVCREKSVRAQLRSYGNARCRGMVWPVYQVQHWSILLTIPLTSNAAPPSLLVHCCARSLDLLFYWKYFDVLKIFKCCGVAIRSWRRLKILGIQPLASANTHCYVLISIYSQHYNTLGKQD